MFIIDQKAIIYQNMTCFDFKKKEKKKQLLGFVK